MTPSYTYNLTQNSLSLIPTLISTSKVHIVPNLVNCCVGIVVDREEAEDVWDCPPGRFFGTIHHSIEYIMSPTSDVSL